MNMIDQALKADIERRGWRPGNVGENNIARMLDILGFKPDDVEQQFNIGKFQLDFALVADRINIEADGWAHGNKRQQQRDKERNRQLLKWGWSVIRIDIQQPDEEIKQYLRWAIGRAREAYRGPAIRRGPPPPLNARSHALFEEYGLLADRYTGGRNIIY